MKGYSVEEIREKVKTISEEMEKKATAIEQLKTSVLIDRGRLEELKDVHNAVVEREADMAMPRKAPAVEESDGA
jgi:uncharacterized coiled-coil DUF342 family protein